MDEAVQSPVNSSLSRLLYWALLCIGLIIILLLALNILMKYYPVIIGGDYHIQPTSQANKITILLPFERSNESIYGAALVYEFDGVVAQIIQTDSGKEIVLNKTDLPKFYVTMNTQFFILQGDYKLTTASFKHLKVGSQVRLRNRYPVQEPTSTPFLESVLIKAI